MKVGKFAQLSECRVSCLNIMWFIIMVHDAITYAPYARWNCRINANNVLVF